MGSREKIITKKGVDELHVTITGAVAKLLVLSLYGTTADSRPKHLSNPSQLAKSAKFINKFHEHRMPTLSNL